ncbi:hypothetical protein EXIGLDRAFT_623418 [Exidia glandulosa HHB12029]|uniref:Uncharacterized protein n=1 Tax=Exidia glandulosa HHB12029 TaxID=1314781 RepID=A0A165DQI1_EXIGL|nr:hypothetical protein EXIGLDRAFT_623418 [Exidia glandulosa HHB12029]
MYGDARSGTPDRYSSRSPFPSSTSRNGDRGEQGQALEVLEFADGRVIWQVVDGLRAAEDLDFDSESGFRSRASFDSGYSLPEPDLQLQVREHKRIPSKGSVASSAYNRKSAYARPETKVFYSDADHIGRLIDSMTRGMNSGSFNVVPNMPTPTGSSFADAQAGKWTMEEVSSS